MRPSKIDRLGPDVTEFIMRERLRGRTLDDIILACKGRYPDIDPKDWPSRSRLGVHVKRIDAIISELQKTHLVQAHDAAIGTPAMPSREELTSVLQEIAQQLVILTRAMRGNRDEIRRTLAEVSREVRQTRGRVILLGVEIAELRKARNG